MPKLDPISSLESELQSLLGEPGSSPAEPPRIPASPAPPLRSPTVLVIDDNEDYRSLVKSLLLDHSYRILEAPDGAKGLKLIAEKHPDLVIVDFNMPHKNGYELIQEVRGVFETRKLPIIMFSGASNRRQLKELPLEISEFLDKPVSNDRLLDAVAKALAAVAPEAEPAPELASGAAPAPEPSAMETEAAPDNLLEMLEADAEQKHEDDPGLELLANDSPLVSRVNTILLQAVEMRASDIHIEPQERQTCVRVRLDGSLKTLCILPAALHPRISARIKIMSNLVITERRLPQDGQFRAQINNQPIEFRVSTLPSTYGEKIVIRVLGQSKLKGDLNSLGGSPRDLDCIKKSLRSPHGLILVTGPTGSGKTTTLYTMIAVLNTPDVNILTAEDPVEYRLAGITQVPISPSVGRTFENVLRAFLRQDPDIMLVGEIRDKETSEIAIKASITGHLVLSTLHTNNAPSTITRLIHMGVAPYLVTASVKLVIAQRLVKLLCPSCKLPTKISEEEKRLLTEEEMGVLKEIFRSQGCEKCRQTGYAGRKPIFEVMPVQSSEMRHLILSAQNADILADLAVREGMTSLRKAAISAAAQGSTSLPEAIKLMMGES